MNGSENDSPRTLGSVQTSFRILRILIEEGEAGVTEISRSCRIAKGTAHTHLATLHDVGFVEKNGSQYVPSLQILQQGNRIRESLAVYKYGWKIADSLAESTGEVVHLAVEQAHRIHYLYVARGGENSIQTATPTGSVKMPHATAAGNAILANYDPDRVEAFIEQTDISALTENTITNPAELRDRLETVRDRGYAINREEGVRGAESIATAIHHPQGQVLGAICLSGPSARFDDGYEERMGARVNETANQIEIQIG